MTEDKKDADGRVVMKLKKKYLTKKAGNKAHSKKNNSGLVGRKALAAKRAVTVSGAVCPEQYGLWAAWMKKNSIPIRG